MEKADVLHLIEAVLETKKALPESHVIAMSMGMEGVISRLLGGWYQSEVTFAAFDKVSAPGQAAYHKVSRILEEMQEYTEVDR